MPGSGTLFRRYPAETAVDWLDVVEEVLARRAVEADVVSEVLLS
jgi:hypothetical protein